MWDPKDEYWGEEDEPLDDWEKEIVARGPRREYALENVIPGSRPEDFDIDTDPIYIRGKSRLKLQVNGAHPLPDAQQPERNVAGPGLALGHGSDMGFAQINKKRFWPAHGGRCVPESPPWMPS
jgi:hypothetical protein